MYLFESSLTEKEGREVNQMNNKIGRKSSIWTLQCTLLFILHRVLRMQCYIKIQAAPPALKVLPVGQDSITCLASRYEIATAREFVDVDIQQCVSGEQTNITLPFNVSIQGPQKQQHWDLSLRFVACHPPPAETTCALVVQRSETAIFQGYTLTRPTGEPILQGTSVDSYFTPFPTSSLEQH